MQVIKVEPFILIDFFKGAMKKEDRYDSLFRFYAEEHEHDWLLLKAQARAESNFDPKARSSVGAMGLCQFMPRTFSEWGEGLATDPEQAIKAQAKYMAWLLKQMSGEIEWALAAYNWGIGNVKKLRANKRGTFYDLMSELPQETVDYIDRILTFHEQYKGED